MQDALEQLAKLVEQASGPDRGLDVEIAQAVWPQLGRYAPHCKGEEPIFWEYPFRKRPCPEFTKSLDAAMTLVPKGYSPSVGKNVHHRHWVGIVNILDGDGSPVSVGTSSAKTGALALTAAALRARP